MSRIDGGKLYEAIKKTIPSKIDIEDIIFACIGTDRSTGDALGPLIGTGLDIAGYKVMGTIDNPLHALNLDMINLVDEKYTIVAIDACLGRNIDSVGKFTVGKGPIKPGAGVGKDLPPVGDYHITGIVNIGGFMEYFVLQNTRLSLVIRMANSIIDAISNALPISDNICNKEIRELSTTSISNVKPS